MTAHPVIPALPQGANKPAGELRTVIHGSIAYFLPAASDPEILDPVDGVLGSIIPIIDWQEKRFYYDPLDSTTAHDGVSTLVLAGGQRYKTGTLALDLWAVIDKDITDPPDDLSSPAVAIGDAYLVPAAGSGVFASKEDYIAIYTARSWEFIEPKIGMIILVDDEDAYYRYNAAGSWVVALSIASATVLPFHIVGGKIHWIVQNQTQNSPTSTAQGTAFIIGPSPTGDFTGHSGKIAFRESAGTNSTYVIYAPTEGWVAYDLALSTPYRYDGSVWAAAAGAFIEAQETFTEGTGTTTAPTGSGDIVYSSSTAPTTSAYMRTDDVLLTHTAKKIGAVIEFEYQASVDWVAGSFAANGTNEIVIALFKDSETNAIDWCKAAVSDDLLRALVSADDNIITREAASFRFTAVDTSEHTYFIGITGLITTGSSLIKPLMSRRLFKLREHA